MPAQQEQRLNVILEMDYSDDILATAMTVDGADVPTLSADVLPGTAGLDIDKEFGAVEIPQLVQPDIGGAAAFSPFDLSLGSSIDETHKSNSFLVRATVAESELKNLEKKVKSDRSIKAIYADPTIEVCDPDLEESQEDVAAAPAMICPGAPPLGTDRHVAARLGVPRLHRRRMDGRGVYVAIVDTGINLAHLRRRGKRPLLDPTRSFMLRRGDVPGNLPVGHGTMCAYDALIAAPRATLLDIALLRSTRRGGGSAMSGLLSDAVRAYAHLYRVMRGVSRPGTINSLVVNNSWGMFHESWDFPPGHPGRYADNPRHPFNRIVGILDHAGADILFAAGNCGRNCPDGRCRGVTNAGIFGANAHPQVTCVAGVDVLKRRVGYSTSGPGRLMFLKPDVCGYTHFRGSGVYSADGGTSAATPVVAGLVAAFRSRFQFNRRDFRTSPAAIRNLLTRTAEDRGSIGFDFDYGWGIANGNRLGLIRSLSVFSSADEEAATVEEVSDIESQLDSIEGLNEVPLSGDDFETLQETTAAEETSELLDELEAQQAVESIIGGISSGTETTTTGQTTKQEEEAI